MPATYKAEKGKLVTGRGYKYDDSWSNRVLHFIEDCAITLPALNYLLEDSLDTSARFKSLRKNLMRQTGGLETWSASTGDSSEEVNKLLGTSNNMAMGSDKNEIVKKVIALALDDAEPLTTVPLEIYDGTAKKIQDELYHQCL